MPVTLSESSINLTSDNSSSAAFMSSVITLLAILSSNFILLV